MVDLTKLKMTRPILISVFGISLLMTSYLMVSRVKIFGFKLFVPWHLDTDDAIRTVLRKLDEPISNTDMTYIFRGDPSDNSTWKFDFSEISKRRFGEKYSEITSFDPLGRNLDFFNPVNYSGNDMIVFEDYGPGIFGRFLLEHRVNLRSRAFIKFEVDGIVLKNTTTMSDSPDHNYPFKKPFVRPDKPRLNSGYYLTFPIAYQHSMRVTVRLVGRPNLGEKEIWKAFFICKKNSKLCPLRGYFSIASNKLIHGTKLMTTFRDYYPYESSSSKIKHIEQVNEAVSKMASAPENYLPGLTSNCELTCYNVAPGEEVTIFSADNVAQVIQSLLFRIYDIGKEGKYVVSNHWERMLVKMTWDGREPQVNNIPLAGLFTVGIGYLREVNSLMAGMRKKKCSTRGKGLNLPKDATFDWLAYLCYEMPFWKSARIVIKRLQGFSSGIVCAQINTKQMDITAYGPQMTGYFSAQLNQYETATHTTHKHKTLLHVENEWGHVVAINLLANLEGGGEELDIITETENAKAPVISGTGFEDYFGYTHHFKGFANKSSIFQGVPFYLRRPGKQAFHVYRHMIFDPIIFTKSVRIYIEGESNRQAAKVLRNFEESSSFNPNISDFTVISVAMFYGRKGRGGSTTDMFDYGTPVNKSIHNVRYTPKNVDRFVVNSAFENQPNIKFEKAIVSLKVRQRVSHTFRIATKNVGVILRREYRSVVPNQKAKVFVDGEQAGIWFCPQRAITDDVALRIDDFNIHPRLTVGKSAIDVTFEAITLWESGSIEVISVVL